MRTIIALALLVMGCTGDKQQEMHAPTCADLAEAICEHLEACYGQMLPACRDAELHACIVPPSDLMACQNALDRVGCDELDRGLPEECE